ncbi:MAG TPA: TAT-variant-translocated molybdopterin oxidoreductase [Bryobacteraceae bacterium]|jgi:molybdopterin-containing oxidoreductase family iron-sulfur binding subunit
MKEPKYWRSLEELQQSESFRRFAEDEFADRTPDWNDPASRRRFLRVMGASLALGGAAACTKQPKETIVPYVRQPEEFVPGKPLFYATSIMSAGLATGALVESHLGRPTKVEGNPDHPASLGATTPQMQATVLTLYDPDRAQTVTHNGNIDTWGNFVTALAAVRDVADLKKGAGLRLLTGTITSPTLAAQIGEILAAFPQARWHQWEPCGSHTEYAGSVAAFGKAWNAVYRLNRAARIVSLDADFLDPWFPGSLRYTRDYTAKRRDAAQNSTEAPRLYVAESAPSITGGMAEHRFRMRAADIESFAEGLVEGASDPRQHALLKDLEDHRGSSVVIAGRYQQPRVHAIAHLLNERFGNIGSTVIYTDPVEANPTDQVASLRELVAEMRSGAVEALLILGGNPVYDAPADLNFLEALQHVKLRAQLGLYYNETAEWCHWHVPEAHTFESWSDARAWDGTASIVQPLIAPIYNGKTPHEVLGVLLNQADRSAHDTVQDFWRAQHKGTDFSDFWQIALHDGLIAGTAFPEQAPPAARIPEATAASSGVEISFRPDPCVGDGTSSNNAWLQELPKPCNKMTWDNALWISAKTAERFNLGTGDIVELSQAGRKLRGPVWIQPGHADESLTIHFGYGRTRAGRVADGVGFNAYALRASGALWHGAGAQMKRISHGYSFATTQHTQTMEERDPFRLATVDEYRSHPDFARPEGQRVTKDLTLFPMWNYPKYKWGLSIDLTACTGCNACMVACQAENNIAVVGKEEVAKGRHMNWIRLDRYFSGPVDDPQMYFQPVPCMHCEDALCELVCPVAATVHSGEGLNEMVYNRCVGTRYCSNNCPYKVRRFNFYLYSDWYTRSLYGGRNPDVSVRSRGVMEKCSYCVQRINEAKIGAEKEDRPVRDGEIITACQQACPANAIVFGNLNDPESEVSRRKRQQRDYSLLEELNTHPRTTYLARLRHPNPDLEKG